MSQDLLSFSASLGQFVNQNQINSLKGQLNPVELSVERNLNFQKVVDQLPFAISEVFCKIAIPITKKIFQSHYWLENPAVDYLLTSHGESCR